MKRIRSIFAMTLITALLLLTGCVGGGKKTAADAALDSPASATAGSYTRISQERAKEMMAADDGHILLDVRTREEFASGHIPNAVCVPVEEIGDTLPSELPDPDAVILVYCRSGRRSKQAAQKLAGLGCTRVYEFGGIIDWDGEVVTE